MVYIIPYFLLELYLTIEVGSQIGFFGYLLWIVITLILGIWLLQNAHISMINNIFSLSKGQIDSKRFYDAQSAYFVGAILLIVPAIFSDILGVISLIYYIFLQFGGKIPFIKDNKRYRNQGEDDVIDVEIIEHSSTGYRSR
ncbi:MAG: FxsA family protein [Epsilonproteobacteria bacterium]|nr:FxsA family protein [Campylobacterota bacterium]